MKRFYLLIAASVMAASVMAQYVPDQGGVITVTSDKSYVASELNLGWSGANPTGFSSFLVNGGGTYAISESGIANDAAAHNTKLSITSDIVVFFPPAVNITEELFNLKLKFNYSIKGATYQSSLSDYEKSLVIDPLKPAFKNFGILIFKDKLNWRAPKTGGTTDPDLLGFVMYIQSESKIAEEKGSDMMKYALPQEDGDYTYEWVLGDALVEKLQGAKVSFAFILWPEKAGGTLAVNNLKFWDPDLGEEPADPTDTAIEETQAETLKAYGAQEMITINAQEGSIVTISNLVGQEVKSVKLTSLTQSVGMPAGLYIVSSNGKSVKVAVK